MCFFVLQDTGPLLPVKFLLCENALLQNFFDLLETLYELGIHFAGSRGERCKLVKHVTVPR